MYLMCIFIFLIFYFENGRAFQILKFKSLKSPLKTPEKCHLFTWGRIMSFRCLTTSNNPEKKLLLSHLIYRSHWWPPSHQERQGSNRKELTENKRYRREKQGKWSRDQVRYERNWKRYKYCRRQGEKQVKGQTKLFNISSMSCCSRCFFLCLSFPLTPTQVAVRLETPCAWCLRAEKCILLLP